MLWNTIYNITWEGPAHLRDSILNAAAPVDASLSVFNDSSLVARVNAAKAVKVDRHFIKVYEETLRINRLSDGMFDPTLSPAITAWGFGKGHHATSDTLRLDSLRQIVGLHHTSLRGDTLFKDNPAVCFNFSALAKGYGCDLVAEMLRRNGVENFLVEIGGEIVASGVNEKGRPWRIAIDRPEWGLVPGGDPIEIINITGKGMATSGNYRNFHKSAEGRYGHTISPRTCRPVATDVISATVIAGSCMEADALATTCMAVGSAEARRICKEAAAPVMLVLRDSSIYYSPSFKKFR